MASGQLPLECQVVRCMASEVHCMLPAVDTVELFTGLLGDTVAVAPVLHVSREAKELSGIRQRWQLRGVAL